MKIGLIGFGSVGQRHYNNLLKFTTDVVVFSQRNDIAVSQQVSNWRDFEKAGPFEVIFVTNETYKHLDTIEQSIKMKPRAIFVEKPLSHSSHGLSRLRESAIKNKIILWVGYNRHFYRPLVEIKKHIVKRSLGKIYYLRIFIGQNLHEWRTRDYRLSYSAKKELGGGVMLDLIHEINYAGWLLGESLTPRAAVVRKLSDLEIDAEDCADSLLTSESGAVISIHQDYLCTPLKWQIELTGSKGNLHWDSKEQKIIFRSSAKMKTKMVAAEYGEMFKDELVFFFKLLRQKNFFTNVDEAINDIVIIEKLKKYGKE